MNSKEQSLEVVENFFNAINKGDFIEAKSYMATNHNYVGPMFSTNNPEDYFEKLMAFEMEFAVETQDLIVAENAVTHLSLLKVVNPVKATSIDEKALSLVSLKIIKTNKIWKLKLLPYQSYI